MCATAYTVRAQFPKISKVNDLHLQIHAIFQLRKFGFDFQWFCICFGFSIGFWVEFRFLRFCFCFFLGNSSLVEHSFCSVKFCIFVLHNFVESIFQDFVEFCADFPDLQ